MAPSQHDGEHQKREYFRVRTRLALRVEAVSPEEFEDLAERIRSREPGPAPAADKALAERLERIEAKLDRLLAHAGLARLDDLGPERDVWLSGSGLRFASEQPWSMGTVLCVDFELPGSPRQRVRALGRVVDAPAPPRPGLREVAVAFVAIHERDRDAVVAHTLEVERAQLRSGMAPTRGGS